MAPAVDSSRIGPSWTAANVLGAAATSSISALYGHYDHNTAISATGAANGDDSFSPADLDNALAVGARLLFTMGCHSGFSAPDAMGADGVDFVQTAAGKGAAMIASTGFGYGDQVTTGLHERLFVLFARELDGSRTMGQALTGAKQKYFASQGLYGAYDEKALATTTLYGLPMYRVGPALTVRPVPPLRVVAAVPGATYQAVDQVLAPSFTQQSANFGSFYTVNGQDPQVTAGRPVQPRLDVDVTAAAGDGSLLPAHGVLITSLTTRATETDFDGAFSRPTLDSAANEQEVPFGSSAFPSQLASITTASDPDGLLGESGVTQRQQLVVIPGQYLSDGVTDAEGIGVQRTFGTVGTRVTYSTSDDWTVPQVQRAVPRSAKPRPKRSPISLCPRRMLPVFSGCW